MTLDNITGFLNWGNWVDVKELAQSYITESDRTKIEPKFDSEAYFFYFAQSFVGLLIAISIFFF